MTLRSHWRMTPRALTSAPVGGEELHHLRLTLRGGPHQGRLPAPVFFGVDVGVRLQQPPGRFDIAAARHGHERCFTFRIPGIGIGACLEQRVDDRRRADDGRFGQRRRAELVLEFDVRAGLDQRADQLEIVVRRGPHDGRRPIRPRRVGVRAFRQQLQRDRAIATLGGVEQRRLRQGYVGSSVAATASPTAAAQPTVAGRGDSNRDTLTSDLQTASHVRAPRKCRRCRRASPPGCCCDRTASRADRQSASPAGTSSADRP